MVDKVMEKFSAYAVELKVTSKKTAKTTILSLMFTQTCIVFTVLWRKLIFLTAASMVVTRAMPVQDHVTEMVVSSASPHHNNNLPTVGGPQLVNNQVMTIDQLTHEKLLELQSKGLLHVRLSENLFANCHHFRRPIQPIFKRDLLVAGHVPHDQNQAFNHEIVTQIKPIFQNAIRTYCFKQKLLLYAVFKRFWKVVWNRFADSRFRYHYLFAIWRALSDWASSTYLVVTALILVFYQRNVIRPVVFLSHVNQRCPLNFIWISTCLSPETSTVVAYQSAYPLGFQSSLIFEGCFQPLLGCLSETKPFEYLGWTSSLQNPIPEIFYFVDTYATFCLRLVEELNDETRQKYWLVYAWLRCVFCQTPGPSLYSVTKHCAIRYLISN